MPPGKVSRQQSKPDAFPGEASAVCLPVIVFLIWIDHHTMPIKKKYGWNAGIGDVWNAAE